MDVIQPAEPKKRRASVASKGNGARRNRSGKITRTKILDAAEQVFIENGIDGTSLRQIMIAAGVNIAAIHYYFGTKDDLLRAVVRRRSDVVKNERWNLIQAALAADGNTTPIEAWLKAWLKPYIDGIGSQNSHWRNFLLIMHAVVIAQTTDPTSADLIRETYNDVRDKYVTTLAQVLPHLTEEEIFWRYRCLVSVLRVCVVTRFRNGVASGQEVSSSDLETMIEHIIPFLLGGLGAPSRGSQSR